MTQKAIDVVLTVVLVLPIDAEIGIFIDDSRVEGLRRRVWCTCGCSCSGSQLLLRRDVADRWNPVDVQRADADLRRLVAPVALVGDARVRGEPIDGNAIGGKTGAVN